MRKKRKPQRSLTLREPEPCQACGAMHNLDMGTWIMTATGKLLCAKDKCWRDIIERETDDIEQRQYKGNQGW